MDNVKPLTKVVNFEEKGLLNRKKIEAKNFNKTEVGEVIVSTDRTNAQRKNSKKGSSGRSWLTFRQDSSLDVISHLPGKAELSTAINLMQNGRTNFEFTPQGDGQKCAGKVEETGDNRQAASSCKFSVKGRDLLKLLEYVKGHRTHEYSAKKWNSSTFTNHASKAAGKAVGDSLLNDDETGYILNSVNRICAKHANRLGAIANNMQARAKELETLDVSQVGDWNKKHLDEFKQPLEPGGDIYDAFIDERMLLATRYYLNGTINDETKKLPTPWRPEFKSFETQKFFVSNPKIPVMVKAPRAGMDMSFQGVVDEPVTQMSGALSTAVSHYNDVCTAFYPKYIEYCRKAAGNAKQSEFDKLKDTINKEMEKNTGVKTDVSAGCVLPFSGKETRGINAFHDANKAANPLVDHGRKANKAGYWYSLEDPAGDSKDDMKSEPETSHEFADSNKVGNYGELNSWLRRGKSKDVIKNSWVFDKSDKNVDAREAHYKNMEGQLCSDINKRTLPFDVVVMRGIKDHTFMDKSYKDGTNIDKGFLSTSIKEDVAKRFAGGNGAYVFIKIPKGAPLMDMSDISHFNEEELLLKCDAPIKIKAKWDEKQPAADRKWYYCEYQV